MRKPIILLGLIALAAAIGSRAHAQSAPSPAPRPSPTDVSVALVLALDTSGSISMGRFELQKQGYAAAFRNPQVLNAILSLDTQSIAVSMMQWTGPQLHVVVIDWRLIRDQASAESFAAAIEAVPRQLFGGGTSISGAVDYSRLMLAQNPYRATRRVIDVSGDGSNNSGRSVTQARDEAVHDGITINGLPILAWEPDLDHYYADNVIGGANSFMIPAKNFDAFADAVLKKLINEIAFAAPNADQTFVKASSVPASQTRQTLRRISAASPAPIPAAPR